ncbi:MAG: glycosyltransferase family 1 protein [Opitutaceae bacterium]
MSAPLLLDLSHTSHTSARTGIQRVARSLWRELGETAQPITYDPHQRTWRALDSWERDNLGADSFSRKRSATWPLSARLRGYSRRLFSSTPSPLHTPALGPHSGLLLPELFTPAVATMLPALLAAVNGPRAAVFHDAIALKFPELTPTKTVARFPAYLRELLAFDGIAANSEDSRATLGTYWDWLGVPAAARPVVVTIPLGIDLPTPADASHPSPSSSLPVILCVGSLEGRKNHLALLEACETLWSTGARFELHLIGLAHPQTGRTALERVHSLQSAGRSLRYSGPVNEATLAAAYATCAFTIYPSLIEGFGLPVLESLARGKPCICSARGALGEAAREGGCITLDHLDAPALAAAMTRLLTTPNELAALARAAHARTFRTWHDYARDVATWLSTLTRCT